MSRSLSMFMLAVFVAACSPADSPRGKDAPSQPPQDAAPPAQPQPTGAAPSAARTDSASSPAATTGEAASPRAAAPPEPAPPPVPPPPPPPPPERPPPKFREITIPAGTAFNVTVLSTLASNTSKVEDPVKGALAKAVVVSGLTVLPQGTAITGSVIDAKESGRVKGKATIAFRFDRMIVRGETYRIQTATVTQQAAQNKKSDVKKGGLGAGLGAIVGGVAGGGTGAAIGAVAGGTGAVLASKGDEVEIAPGTAVTVLLQDAFTLQVPLR
jgi:hypothetical protein